MREPTRDEMVQGIAAGVYKFLDAAYPWPHERTSMIKDGISKGIKSYLKDYLTSEDIHAILSQNAKR